MKSDLMRVVSVLVPVALILLSWMARPAFAGDAPKGGDPLARCNVVWTTPSKDSSGSMPIGNGDVGVNLWVEAGGDLVLLISKTDAWDAHCRLLKLGRVRIKLNPNPFAEGLPFRQTLKLRQGQVEIVAGPPARGVTLRIWVDANQPVVRVEVEGKKPLRLDAALEIWRDKDQVLQGRQRDSARGVLGGGYPLKVPADRVMRVDPGIVWYHRNVESCWPGTMKVQGLADVQAKYADPLLHRTFGGWMEGPGLTDDGPTGLKSKEARTRFELSIYALTKTPATEETWQRDLMKIITKSRTLGLAAARKAHEEWWADFWDRGWIYVSGSATGEPMTTNTLPLRIGAGSTGQNRFRGDIGRAMVFSRALSAGEIAALAGRKDDKLAGDAALVGDWTFDNLKDGVFANRAPRLSSPKSAADLPAKVVGEVAIVDCPRGKAIRLDGQGYLEVAHHDKLNLRDAVTLAAWICPAEPAVADGRILDKSKAATANAYLLDTYPKNSLRMITEPGTLTHKGCLKVGRWTHVAATFDAAGKQTLYLDGKAVASRPVGGRLDQVNQGYALQRFINAAGGRGAMPIKFNGSIFTVDGPGYGPDYRRWGGCYWWQNTRLPYWSMIPCGDWDLMAPLFRMYLNALALRKDVTRIYFDHGGAYFVETGYFWGLPCNDDFGWKRGRHPQSLMINQYIRREWQGGLELAMMMLDRHDYTQDAKFAKDTLVPLAEAVLTFYEKHYPREKDRQKTLRIEPAQALETWWTAVNPMPEVAGLHAVLKRMLALPEKLTTPEQRKAWKTLLGQLPAVPMREIDGKKALAAADKFSSRHNSENPELYAIFPYRLYGLGRPGLDAARLAFEKRIVKGSRGWQQDPVQSAMLGLADTAARLVVSRFAAKHGPSRFPAMWGPNFDWLPDQCHGGNNMMGLQAMILQPVGRKILLLPAWPKGWDVSFKLHAPYKTTVEGVYRGGKMSQLQVTPADRAKDVVPMHLHEETQP